MKNNKKVKSLREQQEEHLSNGWILVKTLKEKVAKGLISNPDHIQCIAGIDAQLYKRNFISKGQINFLKQIRSTI